MFIIANPASLNPVQASCKSESPALKRAIYANVESVCGTRSIKLCSVPQSRCFHSSARPLDVLEAPAIADVQDDASKEQSEINIDMIARMYRCIKISGIKNM